MQSFANADVEMLKSALFICNFSIVQRLCSSFNQIPDPETRSIFTLKRAQLPTEPTRLALNQLLGKNTYHLHDMFITSKTATA
jgi:hypothetical protein